MTTAIAICTLVTAIWAIVRLVQVNRLVRRLRELACLKNNNQRSTAIG